MGKYLPVIVTAECGSLTRAGQILGYAQPNLGHIISRIEDELGVKIFYRDQRGVRLTQKGEEILELMYQIEAMENQLRETAKACQRETLRIGYFSSVGALWIPEILSRFQQKFPEVSVNLEGLGTYLEGEMGVKKGRLACCFSVGRPPRGLECIPLYEEPYFLVVPQSSSLKEGEAVSVWDIRGKWKFLPNSECCDRESSIREIYLALNETETMDILPTDDHMILSMVERGLGMTILPGLVLENHAGHHSVKVLPLKEDLTRTISLLCPRMAERPPYVNEFVRVLQKWIAEWKAARK